MTFYPSKQPATRYKQERGAVLIICLVMLTILTMIGVGTISDVGFQANMAKNAQIRLSAKNTAISELMAQLTFLGDSTNQIARETLLRDAMNATSHSHELESGELKNDFSKSVFTPKVTMIYIPEADASASGGKKHPPNHGMETTSDAGVGTLLFEINSVATLDNTGIKSDQTVGISHVAPK